MKKCFRSISILAGALCLGQALAGLARAEEITPRLIGQLAEEARGQHPESKALAARAEAAAANVKAVRIWEDPSLTAGGIAAGRGVTEEEGDLSYGLEQKLPVNGKTQAEKRTAKAGAAAAESRQAYQWREQRREIAKQLVKMALAEEILAIGREDSAWVGTMTDAVAERYRAGGASQVEYLKMQSEKAKREAQLATEAEGLYMEQVALNRLLNRDLTSEWPSFSLPPIAPLVPHTNLLTQLIERQEPKVSVLQAEVALGRTMADQAKVAGRPDLSLALEGRQRSADREFKEGAVFFKVTIPWANSGKYKKALERERANVKAAELDLANHLLGLKDDEHRLIIMVEAARREATLYRDRIIPQARQALASAHSGWQASRDMFRDVLDGRRMLLDGRTMMARAVAEQHIRLAELAFLCGLEDWGELMKLVDSGLSEAQTTKEAK